MCLRSVALTVFPEVHPDGTADWQADVPEEPLRHVWSVAVSVLRCEHLLKEPVEICVFIYLHGHDKVWREKLRMSVEVGLCDHHWSKNNKREGSCYICFCASMHAWYEENTRCKKPFVVTCSKVWWCFARLELKRRCASMFFITDVANFHPLVILGLPDHLSKNIWGNNCQHLPDGCR